jgi:hypothetical protein
MPVPFLGNSVKGWTSSKLITVITQTIVNFQNVQLSKNYSAQINAQPMPAWKVNRKPEEQRTWRWWELIIIQPNLNLKHDDKVVIGPRTFVIQEGSDWSESGFQGYEAIEDYTS